MADTSKVRAIAWDPSGTAALSVCPIPSPNQSPPSSADEEFPLDVFLSHDGTGCTEEETQCLLRQLDARDDWMEEQAQSRNKKSKQLTVTKLSMDYRAALCECLMQLQAKQQQRQQDMNDDDNNNDNSSDNLELLTVTFGISHLAEIFLLPSLSSSSTSYRGGFTDKSSAATKTSRLEHGPSGSLTADTVRYLRLHHTKSHDLLDSPEVEELLSSEQPEYYKSNGNSTIHGPFEYPYWNLLLQLVKSGQLNNAWEVLTRHSACRHAEDAAMTGRRLTPEGEGFAVLRAILLSAPVPGGRGDDYCVDDAGLDDFLEEDILEREEKDARLNNGFSNDDEDEEENIPPENINDQYVDGVPRNAYQLWEDRPRLADRLRKLRYFRDLRKCGLPADESAYHSSTVLPEVYQPNSAMSIFQTWQEVVKREAFPSSGGSGGFGLGGGGNGGGLDALFRRFPALQQIMSILVGKVPPNIANDPSLTWSESLLMELLYSRPDISPDDIATRAKAIMSRRGGGSILVLDEIILSIMSGSAGQVVETMFSLCGGSSGAALPATITSLLYNLLVDAGCISAEEANSSSVNIQTELLIAAAEAILSSFSVQEQSNVGVRAAVRLLLPHAPPKRIEGKVVYDPRISATIAEAISHRFPDTDAEARDILHLCEEAVRLGSVRIADACESMAFSRASFHRSNGHLHREVYWLLRGMEIQSNELPTQFQRKFGFASRRHFDALCSKSANDLISMLAATTYASNGESKLEEKDFVTVLQSARNVLEAVIQDEDMASLLKGHMEANLLKYVVDIALADALGDTTKMASDIIRCLEERCLTGEEYGGVVSTLANPKMYAKLLHISAAILQKEESLFNGTMEATKCAFSVHGMHILMARLTQVLSWEGITTSSCAIPKTPSKERKEYFQAMRLTLCKGLMRAFASSQSSSSSEKDDKKGGVEQTLEEEVELMLSPCI